MDKKSNTTVKIFHKFDTQQRVALFASCILQLAVYDREIEWIDRPYDMCWNKAAILLLGSELEIEEGYLSVYRDYYPRKFTTEEGPELAPVFNDLVHSSCLDTIETVIKLSVFLITHGLYDARGRTWIRNIVASMGLSPRQLVSLERTLCRALCTIGDSLERKGKDSNKGHDYKRYAKIGAASLGAGALIAFTGGLAAPAVAAAFVVMGGATAAAAATFTTATVMASLFGTAGAGLTGYKMVS